MKKRFIDIVEELINSNLHSSPAVANEVIKIIHDESSNTNDLVKILEQDPPISATILKIANSAYYSPITPIDSLSRAVVALGFMTIRDIAISASVIPYFFNSKKTAGIDLPGLWLHSIGTARAAQIIAEIINFSNQGVVFLSGLLHDIGKIIIWVYYPEYFFKIDALTTHDNVCSILAERKVLNTDHCMIGNMLGDKWNLPQAITTAISYHHEPGEIDKNNQTLARIIELADYICRKADVGYSGDNVIKEPSLATKALLGLQKDDYNRKLEDIYDKVLANKPEIEAIMTNIGTS